MPVSLEQILDTTRGALPSLTARADAVSREARAAPRPPSLARALRREEMRERRERERKEREREERSDAPEADGS